MHAVAGACKEEERRSACDCLIGHKSCTSALLDQGAGQRKGHNSWGKRCFTSHGGSSRGGASSHRCIASPDTRAIAIQTPINEDDGRVSCCHALFREEKTPPRSPACERAASDSALMPAAYRACCRRSRAEQRNGGPQVGMPAAGTEPGVGMPPAAAAIGTGERPEPSEPEGRFA